MHFFLGVLRVNLFEHLGPILGTFFDNSILHKPSLNVCNATYSKTLIFTSFARLGLIGKGHRDQFQTICEAVCSQTICFLSSIITLPWVKVQNFQNPEL